MGKTRPLSKLSVIKNVMFPSYPRIVDTSLEAKQEATDAKKESMGII